MYCKQKFFVTDTSYLNIPEKNNIEFIEKIEYFYETTSTYKHISVNLIINFFLKVWPPNCKHLFLSQVNFHHKGGGFACERNEKVRVKLINSIRDKVCFLVTWLIVYSPFSERILYEYRTLERLIYFALVYTFNIFV